MKRLANENNFKRRYEMSKVYTVKGFKENDFVTLTFVPDLGLSLLASIGNFSATKTMVSQPQPLESLIIEADENRYELVKNASPHGVSRNVIRKVVEAIGNLDGLLNPDFKRLSGLRELVKNDLEPSDITTHQLLKVAYFDERSKKYATVTFRVPTFPKCYEIIEKVANDVYEFQLPNGEINIPHPVVYALATNSLFNAETSNTEKLSVTFTNEQTVMLHSDSEQTFPRRIQDIVITGNAILYANFEFVTSWRVSPTDRWVYIK